MSFMAELLSAPGSCKTRLCVVFAVAGLLAPGCIQQATFEFQGKKPDARDVKIEDIAPRLEVKDVTTGLELGDVAPDLTDVADVRQPPDLADGVESAEVADVVGDGDVNGYDYGDGDGDGDGDGIGDIYGDGGEDGYEELDFTTEEVCQPDCEGKECGDDGCGGECGECQQPQNVCTKSVCSEQGQCEEQPVADEEEVPCDDTNPCTYPDKCVGGECAGEWLEPAELLFSDCLCAGDEQCKALEPAFACQGVLFCNLELEPPTCDLDPAEALVCDDENPCTEDSCDPVGGCAFAVNDDGGCADQDLCNGTEFCVGGECLPDEPTDCDDSNPCTHDTCDPATGCQYSPNDGIECLDDDVCNGDEYCQDGNCLPGIKMGCDDNNPCTDDSCDSATGCQQSPNDDNECLDDNLCNGDEYCLGGLCQSGTDLECDDSNACTDDTCDPMTGCKFPFNQAPCEDEDPCTIGEACDLGACTGGDELDCSDGDPCTEDLCLKGLGCDYEQATGTECDDGDFCTIEDVCVLGLCKGGTNPECENGDFDHDGLPGTQDHCPTAFDSGNLDLNGDGQFDACPKLSGDFQFAFGLNLTEDGTAPDMRRTNEPVEIPLRNGIVDSSVLGYWRFDQVPIDSSLHSNTAALDLGADYSPGKDEVFDHALDCNGFGAMAMVEHGDWMDTGGPFSIMLWVQPGALTGKRLLAGRYQKKPVVDTVLALRILNGVYGFDLWDEDGVQHSLTSVADASPGWQHVAAVYDGTYLNLYLNGVLDARVEIGTITLKQSTLGLSFGNTADGGLDEPFKGLLDEVLWFSRALSPEEVAIYVDSDHPYGSHLVPGAQPDFDDIRIVETGDTGAPFSKRLRIIGPRPHSDTPCPAMYDGLAVDEIPGIEHREDLCGVVGYWPLDGGGVDVMDESPGAVVGATPVTGRFGGPGGALRMGVGNSVAIPHDNSLNLQEFTLEAWVRLEPEDLDENTHLIVSNSQSCGYAMGLIGGEFYSGVDGNGFIKVTGAAPADAVGRWVHVAAVVEAGHQYLFVDGVPAGDSPLDAPVDYQGPFGHCNYPLFIGDDGEFDVPSGNYNLHGAVDEVLIHEVAKSADYIFHRARPGVPKVRFLARTVINEVSGVGYPFVDYELFWGSQGALAVAPFVGDLEGGKCFGLLNSCFGTNAWFRFNEILGPIAADSSMNKLKGLYQFSAGFTPGPEGTALSLDGTKGYVQIADHELLHLADGTLEMSFVPAVDVGVGLTDHLWLFTKRFSGYKNDYYLVLDKGSGKARFQIDSSVKSDYYYIEGDDTSWMAGGLHHAAVRFGSGGMDMHIDHDEQQDTDPYNLGVDAPVVPLLIGANLDYDEYFNGLLDSFRVSNRRLEPDEMLHYPMAEYLWDMDEELFSDGDGDGAVDDGDFSGVVGDNPCTGGQVLYCDDNAPDLDNPDQADEDGDGVGSVLDNCPDDYNPDQADLDGNGEGDLCNPLPDHDHDGVADLFDLCPYAFDPDNPDENGIAGSDACETLAIHGEFAQQRKVNLSLAGESPDQRRTNEPVEIPLANGIIDDSVVGYWPLDGTGDDATGKHDGTPAGAAPTQSVFFDADGGALSFAAEGAQVEVPEDGTLSNMTALTVMTWFKPGQGHDEWEILVGKGDNNDGQVSDSYYLVLGGLKGAPYVLRGFVHSSGSFGDIKGETVIDPEQWSHGAMTWDGSRINLYLNGRFEATLVWNGTMFATPDYPLLFGKHSGPGGEYSGAMDEVVILSRALSAQEIATYVASSAPYGTEYVPGAQSDLDDVRITETPGNGDPIFTGASVKRARVIGPRPHSDTKCPVEYDGVPADEIPEVELREDLCGVLAYWRLDGNGDDVMVAHPGDITGGDSARDRFGHDGGAWWFDGLASYLDVPDSGDVIGAKHATLEAWFRCDTLDNTWQVIAAKPQDTPGTVSLALYITAGNYIGGAIDSTSHVTSIVGKYGPIEGTWHHAAVTYDGVNVVLYFDGYPWKTLPYGGDISVSDAKSWTIGRHSEETGQYFQGVIDEVIVHSVAKSPDYIYHRAKPGIPKLRFLANTVVNNEGTQQAPVYPAREYTLHWGNQDVGASLPFVSDGEGKNCYGLLNGCLGYAGWWRFDDGGTDAVLDATTWKRNGVGGWTDTAPVPSDGMAGSALEFDGDDHVVIGLDIADQETNPGVNSFSAQYAFRSETPEEMQTLLGNFSTPATGAGWFMGLLAGKVWLRIGGADLGLPDVWQHVHSLPSTDGLWHHVAFVRSTAEQVAWFFLDDEEIASCEVPSGSDINAPLGTTTIGKLSTADSHHAIADVDEVVIHNRALTPDELLKFPLLDWKMD